MKNILGLYSAEGGFRLALVAGGKVFEAASKEKTSDNLVACILELLQKANVEAQNIDTIVVCTGPGSFTGNRVAVSFAKGFACGNENVKIVPFSAFDFLAFKRACDVVLVPAFSNFVFARQNGKEQCVDFASFNVLGKTVVAQKELLQKLDGCTCVQANNDFAEFVQNMAKHSGVAPKDLHPVYLRASQAEIEREKRIKNET